MSGTIHSSAARSQELMAMAVSEAAMIPDVDARLTRQLNLAEGQRNRQWTADAVSTLAAARATLSSPDAAKLSQHARLSGWVSASELSRSVKDLPGATLACQAAQAELLKIDDLAKRCLYVMGVANETQYTQGVPAAGAILTQAGPWTRSITNESSRKQAVVSFATALFNLDDFPAGQTLLRQEGDASWRSDMLAKLAMSTDRRQEEKLAQSSVAQERYNALRLDRDGQAVQLDNEYYGRNLQYREVFQNQVKSKSSKD